MQSRLASSVWLQFAPIAAPVARKALFCSPSSPCGFSFHVQAKISTIIRLTVNSDCLSYLDMASDVRLKFLYEFFVLGRRTSDVIKILDIIVVGSGALLGLHHGINCIFHALLN